MLLIIKIEIGDLKYSNDINECLLHNISNTAITKIVIFSSLNNIDKQIVIDQKSKKVLLMKTEMDVFDMVKYAKKTSKRYVIYSTPFIKFNNDLSSMMNRFDEKKIAKEENSYYIFDKSVSVKNAKSLDDILYGEKISLNLRVQKLGYHSSPDFKYLVRDWNISKKFSDGFKNKAIEVDFEKVEAPVEKVEFVENIIKDVLVEKPNNLSKLISNRIKKIDVVIVSVNYNDFLLVSLENNSNIFENITVVTSSSDFLCQKICEKFGVNCIVTDIMYEDGAVFNKGKAINEGIKSISNPDYILLLDADILIMDRIDIDSLKEHILYTSDRYIISNYDSYQRYLSGDIEKDNIFLDSNQGLGFFQLFNYAMDVDYPESSKDASKDDLIFRDKFDYTKKVEGVVLHLGSDSNWKGRKSKSFLNYNQFNNLFEKKIVKDIKTFKICTFFYNPQKDVRRERNFLKFLSQFEGYEDCLLIGMVDYDDNLDIPEHLTDNIITIKGDRENPIWYKEILLNKMVEKIDTDYVIWIDSDLVYKDLHWLENIGSITRNKDFMQLYDRIEYLDEDGIVSESYKSILSSESVYDKYDKRTIDRLMGEGYKPGGSWIGKTSILKHKKLYERMYVGGGDSIFLYGLLGVKGAVLENVKKGSGKIYQECIGWIEGFGKYTYGYFPCTIQHLYHGELSDRNYNDRYERLSVIEKNINKKIKNIVVEVPGIDNTSGGINRMIRLAIELPHNNAYSGGVRESLVLSERLSKNNNVCLRFQRLISSSSNGYGFPLKGPISFPVKWSVGIPDESFPECDVCITYSDNPYLEKLVKLPQVKKVVIYMLSFGMSIERETNNVLMPGVVVACSTLKLEEEISKVCPSVNRIGFGLDMSDMINIKKQKRENNLCLLFNTADKKRYRLAVEIADKLYDEGVIDGVVVFGRSEDYDEFNHPKGLVRFYPDANRNDIVEVFNRSKCFMFPSVTEGLSLTPIESTLCGCPSVICDGAIGEIFFDDKNCMISEKDNKVELFNKTKKIIENYNHYSKLFQKNMEKVVNKHSWEAVIQEISKII
jgi:glycosyltransferase involved in cell wall biosynthesis